MSYLVVNWAKRNNIKSVLIQGNYKTTQKPVLKQLECLFNVTFGKSVLNNVSAIGCKTKAASGYVGQYSNKVALLTPVGLDESKLTNSRLNGDFRKKHGLEGKKLLLYVGKMEQRRNPLFLLRLMTVLSKDYVLVLIGDGPQTELVNSFIRKNKLDNVLVLGKMQQQELPLIYKSSDLFLLASDYEIFGMVILESMYFGVPVISSLTAGSETLIGENEGVIINGYDTMTWKQYIEDICSDVKRLDAMKMDCRNKIMKSFTWDKAVENYIGLYNK